MVTAWDIQCAFVAEPQWMIEVYNHQQKVREDEKRCAAKLERKEKSLCQVNLLTEALIDAVQQIE